MEELIASLDPLSSDVRRNLLLLTDLENRTKFSLDKIKENVKNYKSSNDRPNIYKEIMTSFNQAHEYASDKVTLALQTYDLVDKHIQRLDEAKERLKTNPNPSSEPLTVDMPIDSNEPLYCVCHNVSHGEMVACDNKECAIEWFHFACMNLKEKPKGKWYCNDCFNKTNNKKGTKGRKRRC